LPSPFLEVRGTQELEADALEEAAVIDYETDLFVFPVVSEYRSAVTFSLQEFDCEIVVLMDLESSCHEVAPSFDYLAHSAAVSYTRGYPSKYLALSQARPSCVRLHVPTFVGPPTRHFVEELSSV